MVYPYPLSTHLDLDGATSEEEAWEKALMFSRDYRSGWGSLSAVLPPVAGGPPYTTHREPLDAALLQRLVESTPLQDFLLMRGLGAMLRGTMLWQHPQFREAAAIMLYVSLEA